eukprot:gene9281-9361_t
MGQTKVTSHCSRASILTRSAVICAASLSLCVANVARAQTPSLRDFLLPRHAEPSGLSPGRYLPAEGEAFVVDRVQTGSLLLRFDDNPEVWALTPVAGPRGDVIYKDDTGETVLRSTRLGGLTLFTGDRPMGAPAAYSGDGPSIRLSPVANANLLFQTLVQSSLRASRAAQHLVVFEAHDLTPKDVTPTSSAVLADAAWITAEAFTRLAGRGVQGKSQVARFARVQFATGPEAQAQATGSIVLITINPDKGYSGRPSSARIITVLSRK